jgi:sensor histidine kinase YesM
MSDASIPAKPRRLAIMLSWRRVKFPLIACLLIFLILTPGWQASLAVLMLRLVFIAMGAVLVFGVLERWPARLPAWIARWVLQVVGVAFAVPWIVALAYTLTTIGLQPSWIHDKDRMIGYSTMTFLGLLIAPWMAIAALLRQIKDEARNQALAFDLERSELERTALNARLRLLQAQVEPHFLFNTLANVRELVESGSPQASAVLGSLIAYLRAAVPRLHEPATTMGQEIDLVRAYLEVMHMRIPDRLQFSIHTDEAALTLICPPMTLLTLVENAVRHGIDPSEEGGRIDIDVHRRDDRCLVRVTDTGVGLRQTGNGLGTGLSTLRERLQLTFGGDAHLRVSEREPKGICAEVDFPARGVAT